jgi:protein-L-isoaspartate(D-aspartate) O-methyltransferase
MTADLEARMALLYALRSHGVTAERVLHAIEAVDRAAFVRGHFAGRAYEDTPLPIACGQTISQPSVVGLMTQALAVEPHHRVLEVGTGSGYQAAVLARLARRVWTVDRHAALVRAARRVFEAEGIANVTAFTADGTAGHPAQAPFDRILVTAAAEDPPGPLLAQLGPGGIMVVPVGQSDAVQRLVKVSRGPDGLEHEELRTVRFVPLLEGLGE